MSRMISVAAVALGTLSATAQADIKDLLPRVPASANAIVAVDVTSVLNSPVAKAQGWGTKSEAPLFLQKGAVKVVIASDINLATMDSAWEVGLLEMDKEPSMPGIAMSEAGLVDTLANVPAVWSPRRAYFIALDKQVLGVSTPDDRQFAVRWARQQVGASRPIISKYLQDAALQANSKTGVIMALDLQDAIGLNKVRRALMTDLSRATLIKDVSADSVALLLTSLKGIFVKMQFGEDVSAQIVLDFGSDPTIISSISLPLLKDVLTQNGLGLPDLDTWVPTTDGNKLVFTGKLTQPSFFKVMSLVEATAPASTDAPPAASSTPAVPADPRAATIKASQAYFKAISAILDSFTQTATAGDGAAWLKRASARIDKLPMLNVDPDLLQWGTQVSASLLDGAQQLATGQRQITATAAGAKGANMGSGSLYSTDSNGDYYQADNRDAQIRQDHAKQVAAMVQASQSERARVTAPVNQILAETIATRSKIRVIMVQRYNVEF